MRVITLNANGIRSAASKGAFAWLRDQGADVVCLQETKAQEGQLAGHDVDLPGFHRYFFDAERPGYSGVALYSRREPDSVIRGFGVPEFDREGRYLEARFGALSVVSLYLPSGSSGPERQASSSAFSKHSCRICARCAGVAANTSSAATGTSRTKKSICVTGSPTRKLRFSAGGTSLMDELLGAAGYVDAFREVTEAPDQYTWWSNRGQAWAKNVGWRIDYQIVSRGLAGAARSVSIHKSSRFSDHAPLTIDYAL